MSQLYHAGILGQWSHGPFLFLRQHLVCYIAVILQLQRLTDAVQSSRPRGSDVRNLSTKVSLDFAAEVTATRCLQQNLEEVT